MTAAAAGSLARVRMRPEGRSCDGRTARSGTVQDTPSDASAARWRVVEKVSAHTAIVGTRHSRATRPDLRTIKNLPIWDPEGAGTG
jgi:hypothetical protein